jgi:hypothetical protein
VFPAVAAIVNHGTNALFVREMDRFEPTALTDSGCHTHQLRRLRNGHRPTPAGFVLVREAATDEAGRATMRLQLKVEWRIRRKNLP